VKKPHRQIKTKITGRDNMGLQKRARHKHFTLQKNGAKLSLSLKKKKGTVRQKCRIASYLFATWKIPVKISKIPLQ
jgi:hypothetical protein